MKINTRNRITGALFIAFGLFMLVEANKIVSRMTKDIGSGFFPKVIAVAIILFGVAQLIMTFVKPSEDTVSEKSRHRFEGWATIGLLLIYVLALNPVGFILSTAGYLFIQMYLLSTEETRKWWVMVIFSIIAPVVIYYFFGYLLKMPLPKGLLG